MKKEKMPKRPNRKIALQDEADQRADDRANRSNQEQIALLDKRLGKGKGAVKERKRLAM